MLILNQIEINISNVNFESVNYINAQKLNLEFTSYFNIIYLDINRNLRSGIRLHLSVLPFKKFSENQVVTTWYQLETYIKDTL